MADDQAAERGKDFFGKNKFRNLTIIHLLYVFHIQLIQIENVFAECETLILSVNW